MRRARINSINEWGSECDMNSSRFPSIYFQDQTDIHHKAEESFVPITESTVLSMLSLLENRIEKYKERAVGGNSSCA